MIDDDRKKLGQRLREAREYLGLSQEDVAKALNLTRSAISLIESGQRRLDALELKRFAEVYQRPVSELAGDVEISAYAPTPVLAHLARAAQKLTDADRAELLRFAEFLATKSSPKDAKG
ncbi:helix-turn-helix domain-containing protein [Sorangium sp. So ce1182]|uniref:helix-turn-helix domain-containing protein n=1 Tax=Sorangium sp. So ce1182 TaxID=3133334 RepID=UPI003F5E0EC6